MLHALRTRRTSRLLVPAVVACCGSALALPDLADDTHLGPVTPSAAKLAFPVGAAAATDQFILKYKDPAGRGSALRTESLSKVTGNLGVPVTDVKGTATGAGPAVESAEQDTRMYATVLPNDTYYPLQ